VFDASRNRWPTQTIGHSFAILLDDIHDDEVTFYCDRGGHHCQATTEELKAAAGRFLRTRQGQKVKAQRT
jgi:hypothetical protein